MTKVLSQDEVDALLKGVKSGEIDTESKKREGEGIRAFDFTSQERIIRGRMPGLEMANEKFARFFRNSISTIIMKFVDVNIHSVAMMKFGEFMKTIPFPSNINILRLKPLKGYALFVMETPMVFAFIEFFFGGTAAQYVKSEGRFFTPIEQRIIKKVVGMALDDMATSWKGIVALEPEYVGSEMNPQFVTIVTPSEIVIKVEIHIELEDFTGKLFFCIPYSMVEPIKEKLYSGIQTEKLESDERWIAMLKAILMDSYVEVIAEIGKTELTVGELVELEVGNVVTLGKSISDWLVVKVEGKPMFKCMPGFSRGNQAIKIAGII